MHTLRFQTTFFSILLALCCCSLAATEAKPRPAPLFAVEKTWEIAEVPAAFPVGFCLLTKGERQFVAYYDAQHRMTVAARTLGSDQWQYKVLPSEVGWDSHNYITLALDNDNHLHLSGNMHCTPLIYFRSAQPWEIETLERIPSMTGLRETRCTYPVFMQSANNQLIFHYRDGSSGNGSEIYNLYDCRSKSWQPLLNKPLIDGEGRMNAYMIGPQLGPDGWFYLGWVWRDTSACETNHDPSCARSRDLINWETLSGDPIALPITINTPNTLIDPIPARGGIINGALRIGFDSRHQPIASYHKFDANGHTQLYVARFEAGQWAPHPVTNWDYRWEFTGGGSIVFEVRVGTVEPWAEGKLSLAYGHAKKGSGLIILDEQTLQPLGTERAPRSYPNEIGRLESTFKGMRVMTTSDKNGADKNGTRYILRWETLTNNRDRKPPEPHPAPSKLRLYKLKQLAAATK
ncbi:MAG: BNR repeat-containing protein [Kiritimatiellae bacterium]|nr:BNR repeat-containing protein [Kiritimatiellia bacterium]